jgi:threonine/homoserine/homoserine lactone efflux protein
MLHLLFLGFALAASPGPDFFLILRNTLASGRFAGYMTLLGNRAGFCIHMTLAIAGLSAVLKSSAALFLAIRVLGAAYLVWLGARKIVDRLRARGGTEGRPRAEARVDAATAIRQGFLNNLLNPKVSLFFLSFFPQFASPESLADSPWTVAAVFFVGNSLWWIPLILVAGVGRLRSALGRVQAALDWIFGFVFVGYGLRILQREIVRQV